MPTTWIIGSGIAGMSAAHSLAGRKLDVRVIEAAPEVGGLAKSRRVLVPGSRIPVATEHSWRIYGHGYHVLRAIMGEVPRYRNPTDRSDPDFYGTVLDNLIEIRSPLLTYMDGRAVGLPPHLLKGIVQAAKSSSPPPGLDSVIRSVLYALTSSQTRIDHELRNVSWRHFLGGAALGPELNDLAVRFYVAQVLGEDPYRASASSMEEVLEDILNGGAHATFSVMNGPTNEAFLDHWRRRLEDLGIRFQLSASVRRFRLAGAQIVAIELGDGTRIPVAPRDRVISATSVHALVGILEGVPGVLPGLPALSQLTRQDALGVQLFMNEKLVWPDRLGRPVFAPIDGPWQMITEPQGMLFRSKVPAAGEFADVWAMTLCDPYTPGALIKKPWPACTFEEIGAEVWYQFTQNMRKVLRGTRTGEAWPRSALARVVPWHSYRQEGARLVTNEPKTSPNAGSWRLRPGTFTEISNLLLAGDYVRSGREITRMEAAARSGVLAAGAVLASERLQARGRAFDALEKPLPGRPFERELGEVRRQDAERMRAGLPHAELEAGLLKRLTTS